MYKIGDLILYGSDGVCRVEAIGILDKGMINKEKLFYTLCPIYHEGKIYTPVDTSVFMRPIISFEEAHHLIDHMPQVEVNISNSQDLKMIERNYKLSLQTHECSDLIQMIKTINTKKCLVTEQGKKLGQTDERYMQTAEELLYGEFAFALGISKENVKTYIDNRVSNLEANHA